MAGLASCGLGSVHAGDSAVLDHFALACVSPGIYRRADAYVDASETVRLNREFMYTFKCTKMYRDERVTVVAEDGDLRKIRTAEGNELWTTWAVLRFTGQAGGR